MPGGPGQSNPQAGIRFTESEPCRVLSRRLLPGEFAACPPQLLESRRTRCLSVPRQALRGFARRGQGSPDELRSRQCVDGFVGACSQEDGTIRHARTPGTADRPVRPQQQRATLEAVRSHYIEFSACAVVAPGGVPPPVATTDGCARSGAGPGERAALLAYLRSLRLRQRGPGRLAL